MVLPNLTTCSQYWGTALPEGKPCPGGLAGLALSLLTPISLTFNATHQAPHLVPLQSPFHSGTTPPPHFLLGQHQNYTWLQVLGRILLICGHQAASFPTWPLSQDRPGCFLTRSLRP